MEKIGFNLAAQVVLLVGISLLNHLCEETLLCSKLCHMFRPSHFHLAINLWSNNTSKTVIIKMIHASHFISDLTSAGLGNSIDLKDILRTIMLVNIIQKHFIVNSPVLVCLFE